MISLATASDLGAIDAIYNQAVQAGGLTADMEPWTWARREAWFCEHAGRAYPLWVARENGQVVGFVCLSPYRPGRAALRYTVEISYYVAEACRRRGFGKRLLEFAEAKARGLGYKTVFAILLAGNLPSLALLRSGGYA